MGIPGGIRVFATEVYLQSRIFPGNANLAAAYAVVYLGVALVALGVYSAATRGDGRFVTLGGRAQRPDAATDGPSRWVHAGVAGTLLAVTIVLPFAVMLYTSVLPYYRTPTTGLATTMTLQQYEWVLTSGIVRRALVNNVTVGLGAALAAISVSAGVAWSVVRRPGPLSRVLDVLSTLPIALPGTVLALALLWWYLYLPLPLYATRWVLGLGLVTTFLPYGARVLQAALLQLGHELEEASQVLGARRLTTFRRIVLPLLLPSVLAAVIYMLSRSFKALALPALLSGPGAEVLPIVIYSLYSDGRYPELNALGVLLTVGLAALAIAAHLLLRRGALRRPSEDRTAQLEHSAVTS
jgi:iron(III) transport system permease protein